VRKKSFIKIVILVIIFKSKQKKELPSQVNTSPNLSEDFCSKVGEAPVSNFDMTTGKTNDKLENKECCPGLKAIDEKQTVVLRSPDICARNVGVSNTICSPCGNGICDSQYEDYCNCPEDCK